MEKRKNNTLWKTRIQLWISLWISGDQVLDKPRFSRTTFSVHYLFFFHTSFTKQL
jgi:hypothetical protein